MGIDASKLALLLSVYYLSLVGGKQTAKLPLNGMVYHVKMRSYLHTRIRTYVGFFRLLYGKAVIPISRGCTVPTVVRISV
ncbi:uncharacterized protein F4822DRAFT_392614 [Hypoxylon trugodes]|uniref:uncharacterized protein n=1 Tax=Hypoxylon trugodes TaxID=326681 RepID=UPI00219F31BA|nr:uncharacterized protein F4822DRAFT_392614 [Hypoxylon trugodes]KAI1392929.1 hypothetical protein F4822DRAFT_392614 [Hypoxylon trugodes]